MHSHGYFYSTQLTHVLSVVLLRCHANMCRLCRDLIRSGCLALGCLYNLIPYGQFRDHRDGFFCGHKNLVLGNGCNDSSHCFIFFIAVVKEVYCYAVTRHKQAMFVSERLLIQTRPEKKHMPRLALCKQQLLLRWWQKKTSSVTVNRKCVLSNNKTCHQNLLNTSRTLSVASCILDCVTETPKAWVCGPTTES